MPRGYVICMPHFAVQPLVYPYAIDICRYCGVLYTYRRGVRRCSFRQDGQFSGASEREASDSAGLHVFFMAGFNILKHSGYLKPDIQPA